MKNVALLRSRSKVYTNIHVYILISAVHCICYFSDYWIFKNNSLEREQLTLVINSVTVKLQIFSKLPNFTWMFCTYSDVKVTLAKENGESSF